MSWILLEWSDPRRQNDFKASMLHCSPEGEHEETYHRSSKQFSSSSRTLSVPKRPTTVAVVIKFLTQVYKSLLWTSFCNNFVSLLSSDDTYSRAFLLNRDAAAPLDDSLIALFKSS